MEYDPARDSFGCYALAIAMKREELVRLGLVPPRGADEQRQAAEGAIPKHDYDAAKEGRVHA
jgi:hypothetical protein